MLGKESCFLLINIALIDITGADIFKPTAVGSAHCIVANDIVLPVDF